MVGDKGGLAYDSKHANTCRGHVVKGTHLFSATSPHDNIHLFTKLSARLLPLPRPRGTARVCLCVYLCAHDLHDVYAHVLLPTYDLWPTVLIFSLFLTLASLLVPAGGWKMQMKKKLMTQ